MGYYTGDFYAVGDPGIGSFLGGLAKRAVGLIPGIGPAVKVATDIIRPGGVKSAISKVSTGLAKHPVLTAAGAAGAGAVVSGATSAITSRMIAGGMGAPGAMVGTKGFHMSKRRGGHCPSEPHLVRNRRMRVTNPKALRRAIRRTTGFAKLAMRTIHLVHPKNKGRFGGFKKRVRRG